MPGWSRARPPPGLLHKHLDGEVRRERGSGGTGLPCRPPPPPARRWMSAGVCAISSPKAGLCSNCLCGDSHLLAGPAAVAWECGRARPAGLKFDTGFMGAGV